MPVPYLHGFEELIVKPDNTADLVSSEFIALLTTLSIWLCQNSLCRCACSPVLIASS